MKRKFSRWSFRIPTFINQFAKKSITCCWLFPLSFEWSSLEQICRQFLINTSKDTKEIIRRNHEKTLQFSFRRRCYKNSKKIQKSTKGN
jgi:hypothetical protein